MVLYYPSFVHDRATLRQGPNALNRFMQHDVELEVSRVAAAFSCPNEDLTGIRVSMSAQYTRRFVNKSNERTRTVTLLRTTRNQDIPSPDGSKSKSTCTDYW